MSEKYYGECGNCGGEVVTYSYYSGHQVPQCKRCKSKPAGYRRVLPMEPATDTSDFREAQRESQQEYFGKDKNEL